MGELSAGLDGCATRRQARGCNATLHPRDSNCRPAHIARRLSGTLSPYAVLFGDCLAELGYGALMGGVYGRRGLPRDIQIGVASAFDALLDKCNGSHDHCAVLLRFPEAGEATSSSLRTQLTHNVVGWLHGIAEVHAMTVADMLCLARIDTPLAAPEVTRPVSRRDLAELHASIAEQVLALSSTCDGDTVLTRVLIADDQELEVRHLACNLEAQRRLGWLRAIADAFAVTELDILDTLELCPVAH